MNGTQYKVTVVGEGIDVFEHIGKEIAANEKQLNSFSGAIKRMGEGFFYFNQLQQGLESVNQQFSAAIEPGLKFETSMKEMEAITGVSGEALRQLGEDGRQMAMTFGGDAANAIEGAKLLLSQLTPEIAKNPPALKLMEENAALLSKQLKGDVAGATTIATTAMNAFGISMDDPMLAARQMRTMLDQMTMSAKVGSAELPAIKDALANIGASAKSANVTFAETNAAIQLFDKFALKGAEGGTAFRNILVKLQEGRFMSAQSLKGVQQAGVDVNVLSNNALPLSDRLRELSKIQGDNALMAQFFGRENLTAGQAILGNIDLLDQYTTQIKDSEGATKTFADTVMSSTEEKIGRMKAWVADWGISLQDMTAPIQPFIVMGGGALQTVATLGQAVMGFSALANIQFMDTIKKMALGTWAWVTSQWASITALGAQALEMGIVAAVSLGGFLTSIVTATAAQLGFNIAISANPIGLLVLGIGAAIGAVVLLIKYWDEIIGAIKMAVDFILPGFLDFFMNFFGELADAVGKAFNYIKELFGFGGEANATVEVVGAPIEPPIVPTTDGTGGAVVQPKGNTAITDGLNNVNGGTAQAESIKNITFNVQRIVGIEKLYVTNMTEGSRKAADLVMEALIGSVRDSEIALSGN